MKQHYIVLVTIAAVTLSALAGKNTTVKNNPVSIADQRKAEYIFTEAQIQKEKGNYGAFYDLLQYAHDVDPGNTAVSFYLGFSKIKTANSKTIVNEGLELMKQHFDAHPNDTYESTFYSDANLQLGHPEEALRALKQLNERNPNRLNLLMRLAEAYSETGDYVQSNITYDSIATMFGLSLIHI